MKKADCTPEQWAAYLEWSRQYYRKNREKMRARQRAYSQRPDVKSRRKKYDETPEAAARRRAKYGTPEHLELRRKQYAALRADPEKWAKRIEKQRQRRTGLGRADIERLLVHQKNRCAICERSFEGRQVRADHCHDTGSPRGLLCHHCNIIEGMLRGMKLTPEEFAAKIRAYLDHPPALLIRSQR